jgi:hypothetical protein
LHTKKFFLQRERKFDVKKKPIRNRRIKNVKKKIKNTVSGQRRRKTYQAKAPGFEFKKNRRTN